MTREEAIDLLDNLIGMVEDNHNSDYDTALQMGIKALEQEPCEDCISRQAVLEYIEGSWAELGHSSENELVCQDIKEMPPVTPQPKWIPVSERLPNFNDIVLASADSDYDELRVILTVYGGEEFWFNGKIKAWMPLPKPYKIESEEEK